MSSRNVALVLGFEKWRRASGGREYLYYTEEYKSTIEWKVLAHLKSVDIGFEIDDPRAGVRTASRKGQPTVVDSSR